MNISPLMLDALLQDEMQRRHKKPSALQMMQTSHGAFNFLGRVWRRISRKDRKQITLKQRNPRNYKGA